MEAERLPMAVGGQGFEVQHEGGKKKAKKGDRVRIVVEEAGGMTAEKAEGVLARIFLTRQDRLADRVPEYWKPCVLAASGGGDGKKYPACRFPLEFSIIPGIVGVAEKTAEDEVKNPDLEIVPIRKGVKPPKPLSSPDPEFSAEAPRAKYQGTLVLMIVVDKSGEVRDVRVLRPLGLGLDRRAVERVSTWRFDPGRRDGEPVAVELAVEVDFHLY
jgi:TonB family protein